MKEFILGDNNSEGLFILTKKMEKIIKKNKPFLFLGQGNLIDIKESNIDYLSTVYGKRTFDLFTGLNEEELTYIILDLINEEDIDFSCKKIISIVLESIILLKLNPLSMTDFKNMFSFISLENIIIQLKELKEINTDELENDIIYFIENSPEFYSEKLDEIYNVIHSIEKLDVGKILSKDKNPLWENKQVYIQTRSNILKKIILLISEIKDIKKRYIIQNFSFSEDPVIIRKLLHICHTKNFLFSEEDTMKIPLLIKKAFLSTAENIIDVEKRTEN